MLPKNSVDTRPFKSLLGSERCVLASAGRLSAGDPPSLCGDAAGATLSVNALVDMIAQVEGEMAHM